MQLAGVAARLAMQGQWPPAGCLSANAAVAIMLLAYMTCSHQPHAAPVIIACVRFWVSIMQSGRAGGT